MKQEIQKEIKVGQIIFIKDLGLHKVIRFYNGNPIFQSLSSSGKIFEENIHLANWYVNVEKSWIIQEQ